MIMNFIHILEIFVLVVLKHSSNFVFHVLDNNKSGLLTDFYEAWNISMDMVYSIHYIIDSFPGPFMVHTIISSFPGPLMVQ